jgi:hypothetical protein
MNDLAGELKAEGDALRAVCELLASKVPFSNWPGPLLEALDEAIHPAGAPVREGAKGARLERHLFGVIDAPAIVRSEIDVSTVADRLRADLADLVSFGAGFHLISYDRIPQEWTRPARSA